MTDATAGVVAGLGATGSWRGRSKVRRLSLAFLISLASVRKVRLLKPFVQA
jgi:hypothetical protein